MTAQPPMETALTGVYWLTTFELLCKILFHPTQLFSNHVCATGTGKDTCQNDSGGPMFLSENGRYIKHNDSFQM